MDATPARWSEDTADELLALVQLTFHGYIVAVLADPMPAGLLEEDRPALAVRVSLGTPALRSIRDQAALS